MVKLGKFPESDHFQKVRFRWIIFLIAILYTGIGIYDSYTKHLPTVEILRFYIGNYIFSIIAMWYSVHIYNKNISSIKKWIDNNDILGSEDEIINKLNKVNNFFFERRYATFLSILFVIFRILLIYWLNYQDKIGNPVIDTITIFLIFFLFFVVIDVLVCIYKV